MDPASAANAQSLPALQAAKLGRKEERVTLAPPRVVQVDRFIGGRLYHFVALTSGNYHQAGNGQSVHVNVVGHDLIDAVSRGFRALYDAETYAEQQWRAAQAVA